MKTEQQSRPLIESTSFAIGIVLLILGAYFHEWVLVVLMGASLLFVGLFLYWRKPQTIVLPPPRIVDKPTRRQHIKANGGAHTANEWRMLCQLHNWCCAACGRKRPLTKDHIVPVTEGGSDDISNIQPLCRPCNSSKNNRTIDFS